MSERPLKIGKYNILSDLGQGASADVYLAEDPFNDRKVAVKLAKSDAGMGEEEANRFEKLFPEAFQEFETEPTFLAEALRKGQLAGALHRETLEGANHHLVVSLNNVRVTEFLERFKFFEDARKEKFGFGATLVRLK